MYWKTESQYQRGLGGFKALLKFKTLLVLEVKEVLNPPLIPPLAFINRFSWQHLSQKGTRFEQPLCFSSGIRPPLIAIYVLEFIAYIQRGLGGLKAL